MNKHLARTTLSQAVGLILLGMSASAFATQGVANAAQTTSTQSSTKKKSSGDQSQPENLQGVTVSGGYRHSIQFSTDAKRNAVNVVDTVFSEDIGKFPDTNIAESLNRIPGVQLTRGLDGQGLNVSIRGLGPSFTRVTLDGGSVETASIGQDQQSQDREVDLSLLPSEFFTQLTVSKTPTASMLEGGISGTVDMRTLRPFDHPGTHLTYNVKESWNSNSKQYSPNASLIGSWTNADNTFGALVGVSSSESKLHVDGWESIGWTTPGLTYAQCGINPPAGTATTGQPTLDACNSIGGGNWRIPDTVPATAGQGLVAGQPIDASWLLAHNPDLNISQISNALIPRLGRSTFLNDDRKRHSGVMSFEYKPNENMHFYLDALYSEAQRDTNRMDMDLIGRNGNMIPLNMKVDGNGVVTDATFTNAQFFLEERPYSEKDHFWAVNPGADFYFGDSGNIKLHVQGHVNRSWMRRTIPSILVNSPFTTVQYSNTGGDHPTWTTGVDLNNPDAGWTWNRVNLQKEHRVTETKGVRSDIQIGDEDNNIDLGFDYDQEARSIVGYDNSPAWEKVVCHGTGSDTCDGGAGSAIPQSDLASYLIPGPAGFITADYAAIMGATNYYQLAANAPVSQASNTGATTGSFKDRNWGFFIETNLSTELLNRPLRFNAGVRYVTTKQDISGPVTSGDQTIWKSFNSKYDDFLPSFNLAWTVADNVVLRMAASRTMTRPNPSYMLPNTNFSDPSAETATQGNPNLQPYQSTNFDLGGEWYTGGAGYVALDLFNKRINGFTVNGIRTIPFNQLGVSYDSLLPYQKTALQQRGGPDNATVQVQSQVNADGTLKIYGQEVTWVQPLDGWVDGLGFTANFTHVNQTASGEGVPAVAVGVAPKLWNGTVYWEHGPGSVRLSYTWTDKMISSGANQNGISFARIKTDARGQLDLSASYTLEHVVSKPQITLDVTNITDQAMRSTFQYNNAAYSYFDPGRTVMLGIRGTF
ncbi:TonB-dependent receptor [Oleiagrimonas sp. C23AA]|uniref:TonB-dependent receptor n=1 Tax=Oleiagrimonas sp. C23AA TaxID=2719047 RepID=UPI0014212067|nr:TonB-dependent receptor [Oleiagrimonas sp. C23AA]NII09374.1 TonB-dependent receptor [Oleiagrimonas sp. C23AA]